MKHRFSIDTSQFVDCLARADRTQHNHMLNDWKFADQTCYPILDVAVWPAGCYATTPSPLVCGELSQLFQPCAKLHISQDIERISNRIGKIVEAMEAVNEQLPIAHVFRSSRENGQS